MVWGRYVPKAKQLNYHSLTPTFGDLNKGNGGEFRRLKRNQNMRVKQLFKNF